MVDSAPRRLVEPFPPVLTRIARGERVTWFAYSEHTGLVACAGDETTARERYEAELLPERRPLEYELSPRHHRPPEVVPAFDFSQFHPLDHWAFGRACFGWHGGPRRHLELWAMYQGEIYPDQIAARLLCRLGRHAPVDTWTPVPKTGLMLNRGGQCRYCWHPLPRPWTDRPPDGA